ncbi:PAS domain S-box protein [Rhizobacter sp. Root1221]|uniref:sensor histidine kinase n=1 Tax=Rhizobacter sp. Root1221 TaxID=1736433 RepID=UPI0006F9B943|nr:PAS domain S-box protein [Rhizobacter sp. Root1221]KQV78212.1 hypothetical protein ASC87_11450 [Rhizobacter sp. Root1221]
MRQLLQVVGLPWRPSAEGLSVPAVMSLQGFLSRLIWLCVGPLLALAVYMAVERVRDVHSQRDREARGLATTFATAVDQHLSARIGALKMLAQSAQVDDARGWPALYEEARGFEQSFGSHVILADPAMRMLFNTRVPFGTALPMLPVPKGRAAAPVAMATAKPAVGDQFLGPVAQEPLVAIATPVLRDGHVTFVLLTVFETRRFQAHLDQVPLPAGWSLALLDGRGETMVRRAPPDFDPATDVDPSGRFVVRSIESPWSVVLEMPRGVYRKALLEAALTLALAVLAATLAGVVGGTLASRQLGRAVASLAQPAAAPRADLHITEIAAVRGLLDQAAQRRETAEATLLVSEQRFRRLFDEAPLPQALVAGNGALVGVNARFVEVLGYTTAELPTLADWWPLAYPDPVYRQAALEAWQATVARSGDSAMNLEPVERQVTCKDGAVRAMVLSGIGIGDDFLCTFFDVTERKRVEEVSQRLAAIVESSDDAIVSCTVDGVITSWNRGATRTFGHPPGEAIGRRVRDVIRPTASEPVHPNERRIFHSRRGSDPAGAEEVVRLHKEGHAITVSVVTGVIRDASGAPSALAAILRDITASKRRDAELQRLMADQAARELRMRDLTARLRTLREEECTRISREVHDGLGQLLTGLKMDVRWMIRKLAAGVSIADLSPKLADAEALVDQIVMSVQRIAVELRPSVLDTLGLPSAIRDEARRFQDRSGVTTTVETAISSLPGSAVATALFRILQELLTNTARHANASCLSIALVDEPGAWVLRVRDDGVGIDIDTVNQTTSLGLLGMTERAEAIGGTFSVARHPEGGTVATVTVPYPSVEGGGHAARSDR